MITNIERKAAWPGQTDGHYGYCPKCGEAGIFREYRANGNDYCRNGHYYPSSDAQTIPRCHQPQHNKGTTEMKRLGLLQELEQTAIESFAVCRRAMQSFEAKGNNCQRFIPELARRLKLVAAGAAFLLETMKPAKQSPDATPTANQWVSVKDRLPEKSGSYMLFAPAADPRYPLYAVAWYEIPGSGTRPGWHGLAKPWLGAITHWMEPQPPEEEE